MNSMKPLHRTSIFLLVYLLLVGCAGTPAITPTPVPDTLMLSDNQRVLSWYGWILNWDGEIILDGVKVNQTTYTPEQSGYIFFEVIVKINNPTDQINEIRFPKDHFFLTSNDGKAYELVGLEMENVFMMGKPYNIPSELASGVNVRGSGIVTISKVSWNPIFPNAGVEISSVGGIYAAAYFPSDETWYIGANIDEEFSIGFIFVVPSDSNGFVLNLETSP